MPFHHEYGRIAFERDGERTRVVWTSRFRQSAGPLTGLVEALTAAACAAGFRAVLLLLGRTIRATDRDAGPEIVGDHS